MQQVFPLTWPCLESRRVARNSRKVTIMQPINDSFFLAHPGVALEIVWPVVVWALCEGNALSAGLGIIGFGEAGADEQDVADG